MQVPDQFIGSDLFDYPKLIRDAREARDNAWAEYAEARRRVKLMDADLEQQAQQHSDLSNNTQRGAWVTQQKDRKTYREAEQDMHHKKRLNNEADWRVQRLKDELDILLAHERLLDNA